MEAEKSSPDQEAATPHQPPPPPPLQRKKRNLPGMPDPEADVIALSPTTLMATNRFVCEICSKGFQRDQNLQLHRRGHNLPWKLKQRVPGQQPPRRRVYVCPEATCVHHSPARALGDLTGIKKHFCRKHGEKKFKCERCSKKYAVSSDWKAHLKTCGTREYRCDCGTLFSRRDSFITHRAFCDALAEESARAIQTVVDIGGGGSGRVVAGTSTSPPPPPLTPSTTVVSPGLSVQSSELADNAIGLSPPTPSATCLTSTSTATSTVSSAASSANMVFANVYTAAAASVAVAVSPLASLPPPASFTNIICSDPVATMPIPGTIEPLPSLSLSPSLYLSMNGTAALFPDCERHHQQYLPSPNAAMSATALLQKAAQMGATSSNPSFLRGLGLQASTSTAQHGSSINQWDVKPDAGALSAGLGLGLPSGDVMMGSCSSMFGNRPTLDFLGLGMGPNSALLSSYGGGFQVGATNATTPSSYTRAEIGGNPQDFWDGVLAERKSDGPALH